VSGNERSRIIGAWRVIAYDDRASAEHPWSASYGPDVDGLIVYDSSGWLSVNVSGDGRFDSYFGRFQVLDAAETAGAVVGVVNHEIVASSLPELLALDQGRPFRVDDDILVLGDEQTWRRVCKRMRPSHDAL
jgi:hypothetical protein